MATLNIKGLNTRTDNPKLGAKELSDGRASLFLLYNYGYNGDTGKSYRKKEFLKLYLNGNPRTPEERQHNNEVLALAKKIKEERGQQFLEDKEGYRIKNNDVNLLIYFKNFIDNSHVEFKRHLYGALRNFVDFLKTYYPQYSTRLEPKNLNREMMQKFAHYIEEHHNGDGIDTYWSRFKRMVNNAVDNRVLKESPCRGIQIAKGDDTLKKAVLSGEEMEKLFSTHYKDENPVIRRAFALTCYTGIRPCDVRRLTYGNVDYSNKWLTFTQHKVEKTSNKKSLTIPLSDTLLDIIGEKPEGASDEDLIFHLPSETMCNKALRRWTARAGIDKHITWYCGRHSFATNILGNGANIKVLQELMGHSSIEYTQKYLRAVDELKRDAINSLPKINGKNV